MRDVIIIGAGGGGPVVAKELAARGLDVLLLEAGAMFAHAETDWTHFENDQNNPESGVFRFGPADRSKPAWRRELPQNSFVGQVSGVGGTTVHYFGNSPRAMPGAFLAYTGADAAAYDIAHLFPFSYRDLIPYYRWVEATLPVQTAPMGTKEQVFLNAAGKLGLPVQTTKDITTAAYRPQENAILQPSGLAGLTGDPSRVLFPQAQGCTFCGHCLQGCFEPRRAPRNLKAKRSTNNSYVPMALTADLWTRGKPATLVTDAFAVRITTGTDLLGQLVARSVTWRIGATGEQFTEEANVIVLAAGPIESPRLWLNSGLPNPNDWVGRGLTDHFLDLVVGVLPFQTGASKGPGSNARADFPGRGCFEQAVVTPAAAAFAATTSDAGIAGFYNNGLPNMHPPPPQGPDVVGRLVGTSLKAALAHIDQVLALAVVADDDVEGQNRVTLSAASDEHGFIPRVELHPRARSARTLSNREFLVGQAVQLLRAAGAATVVRLNWPSVLWHIQSTLRMGLGAADSVLDANAEARSVKQLFVADNSALANAVGGPNPTLTTQALATRTAEKIFQLYFGGKPWVGQETPVSSIDPSVTKAAIVRGLA